MNPTIRIEDNFDDVLGKALSGKGLNPQALAEKSSLPLAQVESLLEGRFDQPSLLAVAPVLGLHGPSLVRMAKGNRPPEVSLDGLLAYNSPFPVPGYAEMTVNSYLVYDAGSREAVAFDTGASVEAMLRDLEAHQLTLKLVLLTHTHGDHIAALDRLVSATGHPPVRVNRRESIDGADTFTEGNVFEAGALRIESRLTHGHSPGGTTYLVEGLPESVAIVGDALFCYSIGGASGHFETALEAIRRQILSLPEATLLCPGHGPMTTVGEEKAHNPFFPEYQPAS